MYGCRKLAPLLILFTFFLLDRTYGAELYYRTIASGDWKDPLVWECAEDNNFTVALSPASSSPDFNNKGIQIRTSHRITITESLTIDEVEVAYGGSLVYGNFTSAVLSVSDGPGIDLQVLGSFEDSGPFNIDWSSAAASWALGNSGTMIRTRSTSAALWRDHYENGMSSILTSSNWIVRKQTADNPSISSVNTFYGNLYIENTTSSFWNAIGIGSKIIGINSAPIIKGNFEIGTNGNAGVKFYSQNSFTNKIMVNGNLTIATGSEFQLEDASSTSGASGIALEGNLLVNGILSFDATEANDQNRCLLFSGSSDQTIGGSGSINCYNLQVNKIAGKLFLNQSLSVTNKLFLENGEFNLNKRMLSLLNSNVDAASRTNGWIQSEQTDNSAVLSWNIGNSAGIHVFPFGKNADHYIPLAVTLANGTIGVVSASTYSTGVNNLPFPVLPTLVTNLDVNGAENSLHTVDRFWHISKTDPTGIATLSFTYSSDEQLSESSSLLARRYNSLLDTWEDPLCCQTQYPGQWTIRVPNVQNFSTWTLMEENDPLQLIHSQGSSNQSNGIDAADYVLSPNPFSETLFIHHRSTLEKTILVDVYNVLGEKINEFKYVCLKGENKLGNDFYDMAISGFLLIRIKDGSLIKEFKMMKE